MPLFDVVVILLTWLEYESRVAASNRIAQDNRILEVARARIGVQVDYAL